MIDLDLRMVLAVLLLLVIFTGIFLEDAVRLVEYAKKLEADNT